MLIFIAIGYLISPFFYIKYDKKYGSNLVEFCMYKLIEVKSWLAYYNNYDYMNVFHKIFVCIYFLLLRIF
jgi:hypothetical protein